MAFDAIQQGNIMPPEIRVEKVTPSGTVKLTFTTKMQFPDDFKERLNEKRELIDVAIISQTDSDEQ